MEEGSQKKKPSEKPVGTPFSPFPFGSSMQLANRTPFSGSPGQRILLGQTSLGEPTLATSPPIFNGTEATPLITPRLKAQELYGGKIRLPSWEQGFGAGAARRRGIWLELEPSLWPSSGSTLNIC